MRCLIVSFVMATALFGAPALAQFSGGSGGATAASTEQGSVTNAELEQACTNGDANACDDLGMRYLRGAGVAKDAKKATALFQRACDRGDATGCFNLGESYRFGHGVAKNAATAVGFYQRACDGRDPDGCVEMALSYAVGYGVAKGEAQTALYADRACALKHQMGCAVLGAAYAEGVEGYPKDVNRAKDLLFGACNSNVDYAHPPDSAARMACPALQKLTGEPACAPDQQIGAASIRHCFEIRDGAAVWVRTATKQGAKDYADVDRIEATLDQAERQRTAPVDIPAPALLPAVPASAGMLSAGNAAYARKDYVTAAGQFAKACDAGSVEACGLIGQLYVMGEGVAANGARAAPLLAKACDAGIASACGALGGLYDRGNGVTSNKSMAFKLYNIACSKAVIVSCHDLGRLYENGEGTGSGSNVEQSEILYKKACEANFVLSCYSLGSLYFSGEYSNERNSIAISWYKVACSKGYRQGCDQAQLLESQKERFATIAEQNRQYALMEKKWSEDARSQRDNKKDPFNPKDCLEIPKRRPVITRERKDTVWCDVVNGCESPYREGIDLGALDTGGWSNQCKKSIKVHLTYNKEPVWAPGGKGTYVMEDELKILAAGETGFYPKYTNPVIKNVTWVR